MFHPARLHSHTHNEVLLEHSSRHEYSRCSNKRVYNLIQHKLSTQFVLGQLLTSTSRTSGNNQLYHHALLIQGQTRRAAPRSVHPRRSRVRRPGTRRRLGVRNRRVRRIQYRYARKRVHRAHHRVHRRGRSRMGRSRPRRRRRRRAQHRPGRGDGRLRPRLRRR